MQMNNTILTTIHAKCAFPHRYENRLPSLPLLAGSPRLKGRRRKQMIGLLLPSSDYLHEHNHNQYARGPGDSTVTKHSSYIVAN